MAKIAHMIDNSEIKKGCTIMGTYVDMFGDSYTRHIATASDIDAAFLMCTQMDWIYFDEDGNTWELTII